MTIIPCSPYSQDSASCDYFPVSKNETETEGQCPSSINQPQGDSGLIQALMQDNKYYCSRLYMMFKDSHLVPSIYSFFLISEIINSIDIL